MKSTIFAAVALLSAGVSAQYYNITSKPFQLVVHSHNATYNGSVLGSCHEGAAIESLCISEIGSAVSNFNTYNFNTSSYDTSQPGYGILTWVLPSGNSFNESEPLTFLTNDDSNVALPLFEPTYDSQILTFDEHDRLVVPAYVDDSVYPPVVANKNYDRWYICHSYFEGYQYVVASWVLGKYPPQNPTCVKAHLVRRYI